MVNIRASFVGPICLIITKCTLGRWCLGVWKTSFVRLSWVKYTFNNDNSTNNLWRIKYDKNDIIKRHVFLFTVWFLFHLIFFSHFFVVFFFLFFSPIRDLLLTTMCLLLLRKTYKMSFLVVVCCNLIALIRIYNSRFFFSSTKCYKYNFLLCFLNIRSIICQCFPSAVSSVQIVIVVQSIFCQLCILSLITCPTGIK